MNQVEYFKSSCNYVNELASNGQGAEYSVRKFPARNEMGKKCRLCDQEMCRLGHQSAARRAHKTLTNATKRSGKNLKSKLFFLLGYFVDRVLLVFHAFGAAPVDPWETKRKTARHSAVRQWPEHSSLHSFPIKRNSHYYSTNCSYI